MTFNPIRPTRRGTLQSGAAFAAGLLLARGGAHAAPLDLAEAQDFSFEGLIEEARQRAGREFDPLPQPAPDIVDRIDYDAYWQLRFDHDYALWADGPGVYPVSFTHLGRFFSKSIEMHAVEGGKARRILYNPRYFDMPADSPAAELPAGVSAFSGFGIKESRRVGDWSERQPWVVFMGASYFRSVGALEQVGLSARGIAMNVGGSEPEEFPDFRAFWFEPTGEEGSPVTVYALLEGPSITGAYRFVMHRSDEVIMEIEKHLFFRKDIERLAIAPLTSMFWHAEYPASHTDDWRPEVHDSDTLIMWNGEGERLARPINNPPRIGFSSFSDRDPIGFGLAQRDRDLESYLDNIAYERRPTAWIEPLDDWGAGAVQLVELPTDDEIYDNIVAYWLPSEPAQAGGARTYRYRLHWVEHEPYFPENQLARAFATRIGRGGRPGMERPGPDVRKFVIEWRGGPLGRFDDENRPEVMVEAPRGQVSLKHATPLHGTGWWLSEFDFEVDEQAEGTEPVDISCRLMADGEAISETWTFQYWPGISQA